MKRLLCKVFGHRWRYAGVIITGRWGDAYVGPASRCERCGELRPTVEGEAR